MNKKLLLLLFFLQGILIKPYNANSIYYDSQQQRSSRHHFSYQQIMNRMHQHAHRMPRHVVIRKSENVIIQHPTHQRKSTTQQKTHATVKKHELPIESNKAPFESVTPKGVQHEIIQILGSNHSHTAVAQQLNAKNQETLVYAQKHNYIVEPELDWRLESAVKALPESASIQDFAFTIATVEHLLNDIQVQTAQEAQQQLPLIERSSKLLAEL